MFVNTDYRYDFLLKLQYHFSSVNIIKMLPTWQKNRKQWKNNDFSFKVQIYPALDTKNNIVLIIYFKLHVL